MVADNNSIAIPPIPGHYTNLKYFDVTKKMYAERQMLGEHGDNSGKWTQKQLEIIRQQ